MTRILLELFLEGATAAGADCQSLRLAEKKIGYCRGCFQCWIQTPGVCGQDDDMNDLRARWQAADIFVLATPVYVDGMTAQAKTFIDRLFPILDPHFREVDGRCRHLPRSQKLPRLVLLSCCGFWELENFEGLVQHVQSIAKNLHTPYVGAVLRPASSVLAMDLMLPEPVSQVKSAVRQAGAELVEQGGFDASTLAAIAKPLFSRETFIDSANLYWDRQLDGKKS